MAERGFTIRAAVPQDVPQITAIYAQAVKDGTASFELTVPDEAEMRSRFETLITANYPYLVAHDTREPALIAGYAYAGPYRTRPAYRWSVESSVYVRPDHHGRGIGSGLLRELIERASERGFRQMVAIIGDSNNASSIALHAKAGFERTGTLKDVGFKHGRWLDTVIMQKTLGRGSEDLPSLDEFPGNLWTPPTR